MTNTKKAKNAIKAQDTYQKGPTTPAIPNLLELASDFFYWIDESLQNQLRKNGWPEITRAQSQVLTCMGAGHNRTVDIARHMGVSKQGVNRSVNELIGKGLLKLELNPSDRRSNIIVATAEGEKIARCAYDSFIKIEQTLENRLGSNNFKQLRKTLESSRGEPLD